MRRLTAAVVTVALTSTCATTQYEPLRLPKGVLTLRYDGGVHVRSGEGRLVAEAPEFDGLTDAVACHDNARKEAAAAESRGSAARVLGFLAVTLAVGSQLGWLSLSDHQNEGVWLGAGIGSAALAVAFATLNIVLRHQAAGHAVDAVNLHNDAYFSGGGGCVAGAP
jgi:hypothetical protein